MDGLENLARNLGTYSASTDGMLLHKPAVIYGVLMDDDDNLYSNMKATFTKESKTVEPASAKPASRITKPSSTLVTANVYKPASAKNNKPASAKVDR